MYRTNFIMKRHRLEVDQILHHPINVRAPPAALLASQDQKLDPVGRNEFGVGGRLGGDAAFDGHAVVIVRPRPGRAVLVKRAHHAHVAHDRQASANAQAPHDDIRLPIVARPDARDQFTDERVLLRVDAGFRPQRAESALESSPSASEAARPWTRGRMVAELVQPRAASAETNVSGAMGATRRE